MRYLSLLIILVLPGFAFAQPPAASPGNRLAHMHELDPYYPHAKFPKFITPQWVGEPDVEAVVILAIDDMRDPKKYESYLRPILNRLKKIDGRAPVSIMTCNVDPKAPHLQSWLKEGVSFDVHTVDHPCPYFKIGFEKSKDTTDRCIDLLNAIPNNRPVAFRMPCCDSLNTPSPRHWAEIFNKTTSQKNYLSIDSSVFTVFTSADTELPNDLVFEDGKERFKKYLPMDREFVNWIENYPYPYLIGKYCWQFPCMTPSDWEAQHLQKPNNPLTVRDWKAALDCTVIKKGVFTMVFHPHGWIKAEQVIELIDHAVEKHGKKVKFLTFQEAHARLRKSLLHEGEWRSSADSVFLLDMNNDGYLDIMDLRPRKHKAYVWNTEYSHWRVLPLPERLFVNLLSSNDFAFGVLSKNGLPSVAYRSYSIPMGSASFIDQGLYHFDGKEWIADKTVRDTFPEDKPGKAALVYRLLDLDGDGVCEMIDRAGKIYRHEPGKDWQPLSFAMPIAPTQGGVRFVDLTETGKLDLVYSNEKAFGVYRFVDMKSGWQKVRAGKAGEPGAIPMIDRLGTNNGCFAHSGKLWWANEDTHLMKNHVDRRAYKELLQPR
jgi:hypothetical protein